MTNDQAINILTHELNEFLDEFVDYGGVGEAYSMGINALKREEYVKPSIDGETAMCGKCGRNIPLYASWCPWCGVKVRELNGIYC